MLINFLHQPDVLDVPLERAGKLLSFYWGGAFIGRIIGSSADSCAGMAVAHAVRHCRGGAVSHRDSERRRGVRLRGARHRPVQLDHVPGDLHADAGAVDGFKRRHFRSALHGDRLAARCCRWVVGWMADHGGLHVSFFVPMVAYGIIAAFAFAAGRAPHWSGRYRRDG